MPKDEEERWLTLEEALTLVMRRTGWSLEKALEFLEEIKEEFPEDVRPVKLN